MDREIILCIIGVLLIIVGETSFEPKFLKPEELGREHINKIIKTKGEIERIVKKEDINIIYLKNSKKKIVDFQNLTKKFSRNDKIDVIGKVSLYRKNIQIVVDEVDDY